MFFEFKCGCVGLKPKTVSNGGEPVKRVQATTVLMACERHAGWYKPKPALCWINLTVGDADENAIARELDIAEKTNLQVRLEERLGEPIDV
jgi:hypothetical protein